MQLCYDTNDSRIGYIDVFRGIGIILMVLGHMELSAGFYKIIHAFHMPMFFFIAGYCHHPSKKDFINYCKYKAKGLLIPYFVFGIGEFILWRIAKGDSFAPLWHLLSVNTDRIAIAGAIWFLTALYITEIVYFVIDKSNCNKVIELIVVVICSVLGMLIPQIMDIRLPFGLDCALVGLGFYCIGKIIRENENSKVVGRLLKLSWWQQLAGIIIALGLINLNGTVNMRTANYSNVILFWLNAILSILLILNISKMIEKSNWLIICNTIKTIGKDGIVYVCLNQLIITVISEVLLKTNMKSWCYYAMLPLLSFVGLWICGRIITTTRLSILVGKRV